MILKLNMSSLEKLGIAGFRSYHPDDIQFVDFFRPLTLICGENGSGKTVRDLLIETII